jgi:hypothetical protein
MRSIRRSIGLLLVAAATLASTVTPARPAAAAEPTRVQDTSTSVKVAAANGDRRVEVSVERSESTGAYAAADLYGGPASDVLARGTQGISAWTDTTFRAEVQLFDRDERPVGTVSVAGTYATTGAGQRR